MVFVWFNGLLVYFIFILVVVLFIGIQKILRFIVIVDEYESTIVADNLGLSEIFERKNGVTTIEQHVY